MQFYNIESTEFLFSIKLYEKEITLGELLYKQNKILLKMAFYNTAIHKLACFK